MIANTNSTPSVAAANLNNATAAKTPGATRASQPNATLTDEAAELALLNGTDFSAAQSSNPVGFIPDAAGASQGAALATQNMLNQPGAAMLAQANLSADSVLKLLA